MADAATRCCNDAVGTKNTATGSCRACSGTSSSCDTCAVGFYKVTVWHMLLWAYTKLVCAAGFTPRMPYIVPFMQKDGGCTGCAFVDNCKIYRPGDSSALHTYLAGTSSLASICPPSSTQAPACTECNTNYFLVSIRHRGPERGIFYASMHFS